MRRIAIWFAGVLTAAAVLAAEAAAPAVKVLRDLALPAGLERANDIRWPEEGAAWISAGRSGTFELSLAEPGRPPRLLAESPPGAMGLHFYLAWAAPRLWLAAPVRALGWRELRDGQLLPGGYTPGLDSIHDIDAFADRALVLGASRGKDGSYCPDGAIAWLGTITGRELALEPVMFSSSGPGAQTMDHCGMFDEGKVRFLADGSFLIVPGVEPGVFWYDPAGKLKRTWTSEELGLDGGCTVKRPDVMRYSTDEAARYRERINQRVIVDEILALPQGPALVTRHRRDGLVRWNLLRLSAAGEVRSETLPLTSPEERAHLRGDSRGLRVLLLLRVADPDRKDATRVLQILELAP